MARQIILVYCFLPLFFPLTAIGQIIERVSLKKYSQAEGLNTSNIRKIVKDNYGFLWIASQDGLYRFDGISFLTYSKSSETLERRLLGIDVRDLVEDSARKCIWVLTGDGGINKVDILKGQIVESIPFLFSLSEEWNICMRKVGNKIWIGSSRGVIVYDIVEHKFDRIKNWNDRDSPAGYEVRSIANDSHGNVWVFFNGYGACIYNAVSAKNIKHLPFIQLSEKGREAPFPKVYSNLPVNDSTLLIGTDNGLRKIWYDASYNVLLDEIPCFKKSGLNTSMVRCIEKNSKGEIYAAFHNVFYKVSPAFTDLTSLNGPIHTSEINWLTSINSVFIDEGDNLWLGSQFGLGLIKATKPPLNSIFYDPVNKIKLDNVYSIYPVTKDQFYVACRSGLIYVDAGSNKFKVLDDKNSYYNVFKNAEGILQASSSEAMYEVKGYKLVPIERRYPFYKQIPFKCVVNNYLVLNDSISCLSTDNNNGIILINYKKGSVQIVNGYSTPIKLGANLVNMTFKDKKGSLFVLSDNIITVIGNDLRSVKTFQLFDSSSTQPLSIFFDMCASAGYYWVAAYGIGILKLDSNYKLVKKYSTKDKLCNNGVYKVFNLGDTGLVITSNNGLSLFDIRSERFSNYYERDGLHSNIFEEACGTASKEEIYAGGTNGFSIITPRYFYNNTVPPRLYFKNIQTETTTGVLNVNDLFVKEIFLPNNWLQTTISFVGINYLNPNRVVYRYRIKEMRESDIEIDKQNFVSIIGLNPGTYTLSVQAANENGIWSDAMEVVLNIAPKWYQTWWFKVIVALVLMGGLYSLYRYRLAQVRKEQQIRQRIASDLHDDIGSTLNSVKVFANLALMKPENNTTYLQQLKEGVQSAIVGVRDMVWVLDDKQDSLDHLAARIEQFIYPVVTAQELGFKKSVDPSIAGLMLKKEEKRNLYLILKEALNNSIKYANASVLELEIRSSPHHPFAIVVRDNGTGFDVDTVPKGNGLQNLYYRAQQIKYSIEINSAPGKGTTITLTKA